MATAATIIDGPAEHVNNCIIYKDVEKNDKNGANKYNNYYYIRTPWQ